jgi:uncharacterized membrane protein YeiH
MLAMLPSQLAERPELFELPLSFSLVAHFTFGVTGALAAIRRGYDFIGVLVLAIVTAGGGGLIRDGLLISKGPASMLTDAYLLPIVVLAAILTLFLHRYVDRIGRAIAVIDALGLGAFAVHGVQRSMEGGLSLPGVILGGTITAVGGGLLRDVLAREEPLLLKPGQFYALVAIGGCGLFLVLIETGTCTPHQAGIITTAAVFAMRMLSIHYNWQTRALYREPPPAAS